MASYVRKILEQWQWQWQSRAVLDGVVVEKEKMHKRG